MKDNSQFVSFKTKFDETLENRKNFNLQICCETSLQLILGVRYKVYSNIIYLFNKLLKFLNKI